MPLTTIKIRKDEATRKIHNQINEGREIRDSGISLLGDLGEAIDEELIWSEYNRSFVEHAFGENSAQEYDTCVPDTPPSVGILSSEEEAEFLQRIDARILWLRSILKQVPLMRGEREFGTETKPTSAQAGGSRVFIVHGHDEGAKDAVTLFVRNLGLTPIVLQNKPNEGVSLDRKLEKYSDVDCAIVILTPDDGRNPRPNVALELGWFRSKIGEEKVCMLYKEGTDIPSDVGGVERTLMDRHGGWKQKLARDIKAMGFYVDPDWFSKG